MAADPADVANLARKLRGKGLSDEQVSESLTGLGYTKTQAGQAITAIGPTATPSSAQPAAAAKKAPPKGTRRTATPGASPAAITSPQQEASPPAAGSSGAGGGTGLSMPSMPKVELPSLTLTPPRRLSSGDLGGFAAGLLVYTLALNYLRYGSEGVTGWVRAKFLNQPAEIAAPPEPRTAAGSRVNRDPSKNGLAITSSRAATTTRPQPAKEV